MNRGFHTQITTDFDGLLKDSSCTFCGQCVQTCPTGALGDKKALRAVELPEPLPDDAHLALTFQACDATTCLRPETIELEIP